MSLAAQYQRFLASPTADALAASAQINYVPTLATISAPAPILKHLATQAKLMEKKEEKVLNAFESENQLCLETQTTLKCHFSGGTYLPGMDDNLLADRVLQIPIIHIVTFDSENKIQQIRLSWDQGSLLKQVEVIGRNGRNWPLNDGVDQGRLVASSIKSGPAQGSSTAAPAEEKPRQARLNGANGEKYTTLSLFKPREEVEREDTPPLVAPRASAKPPPRDPTEIFGGPQSGIDEATSRPASPSKGDLNPLKAGAGKHYQENRLFYEDTNKFQERGIKTNPKKYNHFELGSGDAVKSSPSKPYQAKKHLSQWDFSDFVTPEKHHAKVQEHSTRHISWSDDEDEAKEPPKRLIHKPQPRPDAEPHFDLKDDVTPKPQKAAPVPDTTSQQPLGNITNQANQAGHRKTFSSQFDINDNSPPAAAVDPNAVDNRVKDENVMTARANASKTLAAGWDWYNQSPQPKQRGINIKGNGMGSRATEPQWWDF